MPVPGKTLLAIHDICTSEFDESDWKLLGLLCGRSEALPARLFDALKFGDDDYRPVALRTLRTLLQDDSSLPAFLAMPKLRRGLQIRPWADQLDSIVASLRAPSSTLPRNIALVTELHPAICSSFDEFDWDLLAIELEDEDWVQGHSRLLRSLRWGDDDYPGHVIDFLFRHHQDPTKLAQACVSIPKIRNYLQAHNPGFWDRYQILNPEGPPLSHSESPPPEHADATTVQSPDLKAPAKRLEELQEPLLGSIPAGNGTDATSYHREAFRLLSLAFAGQLVDGKMEQPVSEQTKRLDINFTNMVLPTSFFGWLNNVGFRSPNIIIECKNYSKELGNPEVDQLAGRLSGWRGNVGLLLYRAAKDQARLEKRCRAVLHQHNAERLVLPIDDTLLLKLFHARDCPQEQFRLLKELYDRVTD